MANEYEDNVRWSIWQSISRPRLTHWSPLQGVRDSRCLPSNMLLFFAHQILNFALKLSRMNVKKFHLKLFQVRYVLIHKIFNSQTYADSLL